MNFQNPGKCGKTLKRKGNLVFTSGKRKAAPNWLLKNVRKNSRALELHHTLRFPTTS